MEITVRRGLNQPDGERNQPFVAAVTFLQPGPLALQRISLSARSDTYSGAMKTLTAGFKVTPSSYEKDTPEFRVLTALCTAQGVIDMDS